MNSAVPSERIDPRVFHWTYAVVACVGGLVLTLWGVAWFPPHLPGQPWGGAALVRVFGAFIVSAGCFAGSLATMTDPLARRRVHPWFVAANAVLFLVVASQVWTTVADWDPARWAALVLFAVVAFGVTASLEDRRQGAVAGPGTPFGGAPPEAAMHELRSRYEQQIRDAAAQEERNRLARDLHDSIKQQVFAIQTAAATAQVRFDTDPAGAKTALDQVRASAREATIEMEAMLDQLRASPLENVGLIEALKRQCEALAFRLGATVEFTPGALPPNKALGPGAHQTILRVAQEALANVGRHSRAANVHVSLDTDGGRLELKVSDDGVGFDPGRCGRGMGLANMRQRAREYSGALTVSSAPGSGTTVSLALPCRAADPPAGARHHLALASLWALFIVIYVAIGLRRPGERLFALCFVPLFIGEALLYLRVRRRPGRA